MSAKKRIGRWLLYSICLAPAILMLAYYFLGYVPAQREYFMNLRFRALAVVGDQLRSKVQNLASSLKYATEPGPVAKRGHSEEYISALLPELNLLPCVPGKSIGPSIDFGKSENTVQFDSGNNCPAQASLSQILSSFSRDELFDDVVVAEPGGRVIYQRSTSSPRIVNLDDLMKAVPDPKAILREGSGKDADAVRSVRLDDSDYVLLLQPVRISTVPPLSLTAAGLVHSQRLAEEARHVPPKYLLMIFAPLAVLLLSGPFLKIVLLTRTGRLAIHDMALLSLFTLIAGALATVMMLSWHKYGLYEEKSAAEMTQFAKSLNEQIALDLKRIQSTLEGFDKVLPANIVEPADRDRTDLLKDPLPVTPGGPIPFNFVFWTNRNGCQVVKWTTRLFNTPRVDQADQEYFQNVLDRTLWSIAGDTEKQFTLQTLVSPTTSQLIVVMAIPSSHKKTPVKGCDTAPAAIVSAAIVAPLPSLSGPLVPPGVGFAIVDPGGRVLFHSSPERNLRENLFEEIHSPAPLRAAVAMRTERSLQAYYRGRQYQFRLQPVTDLGGIPWTIAVFREIEPQQAMMGRVWGETLALFLALMCVIAAGFLLLSLILKAGLNLCWRDQVDFIFVRIWPDPARRPMFRRLTWELGIMALLSISAITAGTADAYHSARWLLPFCFLLPVAAIGLTAFRMWKPDPASCDVRPTAQKQHWYIACLSLLLVLLALVPNLGFLGICHAYEARLYLMHWQQRLLNSVDARRSRMVADLEGSSALSDTAKTFIRDHFLTDRERAGSWDKQKYLQQFAQTRVQKPTADGTVIQPQWWKNVMSSIRPETESNALETGVLARSSADAGSCRWYQREAPQSGLILRCATGSAEPVEIESTLTARTFPTDPLWWFVALALLGVAYAWNCLAFSRLFNLDFNYIDLPLLTEVPVPAAMQEHLLVLGLPLARKDAAVREWLGYTPPRVNLYEEHFWESWCELTCARLEQELGAINGQIAQAAASGGTVPSVRTTPRKPWIHISNLEAKLCNECERQAVAALLEKLIMMNVAGSGVCLIVTSNVDPVFHFDSVLSDERKKIYEHPLPELELQRWARLLHNFRKVRTVGPEAAPPTWVDTGFGSAIYQECRHHQALLSVGAEVAASAARRDAILPMIAERAYSLYKLFWASCTRSEKLLLIQVAQTGLVNPLCNDTLADLVRKGLILPEPRPRIMNETFRSFLQGVEAPDAVREWESEGGESSWLIIRNVALVLIVIGLAVLALTQQQALQNVSAILTGVGAVLAGLFRLLGYFTGKASPASESRSA